VKRTFIIAEVGVNHNADLTMARALVDVAVHAGADAVKFQTAVPELVATGYAEKATYQKKTTGPGESQLAMIRKLHFPLETYRGLQAYCAQRGITFFSTAFDMVSLEFLEQLGQPFHKVPSGEITNLPYLRRIGQFGKPVFLSTGMADIDEIRAALRVVEEAGTPRDRITVLHCTAEYPAPMADVNLRAMVAMRETLGVQTGYSDHTVGLEVAVAAAALGATAIEKHFTLDRDLPGPDHKASLEPNELAAMVKAIRNIDDALGDGVKAPSARELENRMIARRSLVASRQIRAGEVFSGDNLLVKRPATGISPMRWDEVVGRRAPRDFAPDELIEL
jgi:N,N'-diacetyllegionaminate synthase